MRLSGPGGWLINVVGGARLGVGDRCLDVYCRGTLMERPACCAATQAEALGLGRGDLNYRRR